MKLELGLIRALLKSAQDDMLDDYMSRVEPARLQAVIYHLELLSDEGLIKDVAVREDSEGLIYGLGPLPRLTASGQALLAGLENPGHVRKIKEAAKAAGVSVTLSFAKACIDSLVAKLFS